MIITKIYSAVQIFCAPLLIALTVTNSVQAQSSSGLLDGQYKLHLHTRLPNCGTKATGAYLSGVGVTPSHFLSHSFATDAEADALSAWLTKTMMYKMYYSNNGLGTMNNPGLFSAEHESRLPGFFANSPKLTKERQDYIEQAEKEFEEERLHQESICQGQGGEFRELVATGDITKIEFRSDASQNWAVSYPNPPTPDQKVSLDPTWTNKVVRKNVLTVEKNSKTNKLGLKLSLARIKTYVCCKYDPTQTY